MKSLLLVACLTVTSLAQAATFKRISKISTKSLEALTTELDVTVKDLPIESPDNMETMVDRQSYKLTNPTEAVSATLKQLAHRLTVEARDTADSVTVKKITLTTLSSWERVENIVFGAFSFIDNPETQMTAFSETLVSVLQKNRVELYSIEVIGNSGTFSALGIVDTQQQEILLLGSQYVL